MKKVYINPGHSDTDPGAVGFERERRLNVAVAGFLIQALERYDQLQIRSNPGSMDSLTEICNDANSWGADLFVSVHFNAGGGDGFECYVHNESRRPLGQLFEKQVLAIGQNSRGVKLQPGFIVLRRTNMPAVLLEGAFVDNQKDIADWNEDGELKRLAEAYAAAVAEYLELQPGQTLPQLPVLRRESRGATVSALQKLVGVTADGIFGPRTEAAVIAFQQGAGIAGDGVVGAMTWRRLLGLQ